MDDAKVPFAIANAYGAISLVGESKNARVCRAPAAEAPPGAQRFAWPLHRRWYSLAW